MPELTPLSDEELTQEEAAERCNPVPDFTLQRLLATVRAREVRIAELEGRRCGTCRHSIALASAYVMCRGRGRKGKGDLCEIWEASNNE